MNEPICICIYNITSVFMLCRGLVNVIRAKMGSLETSFLSLLYPRQNITINQNGSHNFLYTDAQVVFLISYLVWINKVPFLWLFLPWQLASQARSTNNNNIPLGRDTFNFCSFILEKPFLDICYLLNMQYKKPTKLTSS